MGFVSAHARGREIRLVDAHNGKMIKVWAVKYTDTQLRVALDNLILVRAHGTEINAVQLTI